MSVTEKQKLRMREYYRKRYNADPIYRASYIANKAGIRLRNLKIVAGLKNRPCMDCQGWFNPWQMQFDHKPGTIKWCDVGSLCNRSISVNRLMGEIAKCEIVCANCHWDRTYQRLQEKKWKK